MGNRTFCANLGVVDEHAQSMFNIHFREENSFVLPKPNLAEVSIEHAYQITTKGFIGDVTKVTGIDINTVHIDYVQYCLIKYYYVQKTLNISLNIQIVLNKLEVAYLYGLDKFYASNKNT